MDNTKYNKHFKALARYNSWEKRKPMLLNSTQSLSMVGNLYELIPEEKRQRSVDVSGIIKMRKALSVLKAVPQA